MHCYDIVLAIIFPIMMRFGNSVGKCKIQLVISLKLNKDNCFSGPLIGLKR